MKLEYQEHITQVNSQARSALKQLDLLPDYESRTLFALDNNRRLCGCITDGDIRRGLLAGHEISEFIEVFMNTNFKFLRENEDYLSKLKEFKSADIVFVPVLDTDNRLIKILNLKKTHTLIPSSAVIMAGGRGERLKPFTDSVPKPMLIVGSKPIIEHNIDRLISFGITEFYISINYLGEQIINHFGDGKSKGVNIKYLEEDSPLGTIGAVNKITNLSNSTVLVMNSDILTNLDFEDFYLSFIENEADMSVASIPYSVKIPYAVLNTMGSSIQSFAEKPEYTYYSNGGIYFLKKDSLSLIPKDKLYNATDLMQDLINSAKKVCHYPILNYWLDVGKQHDYLKAQEDIKHIKF